MLKIKKGKIFLTIILSFAFLLFTKAEDKNFEIGKNLDVFNSLYRELDMFYVDSINAEQLIRTGIDAMLESLDPYTTYIPETELEEFKFMTTGEYAGVGAVISMDKDKNIVINEPYEGKPAAKAGLKAGDIIFSIDGEKLQGVSVSEASEKLKGRPGTKIKLVIQRPGEKKKLTVPIERELIQIEAVTYSGVLTDSIGYIFLNNFTDKSGQEVRDALLKLKDEHHIKSLILDLRGNPGGILEEAVQVVNLFVPKGELIVSTKGKVKQWDKSYRTTIEPIDTLMPLVVLTNSGSASASEIVSGALQDLDRAIILGTRTFGKGLVQSTREVAYDGNLKLTIAKYYIPSGRLIQALDYSHRNPDGSVGRVPDSLTNVFKTSKGRLVRDGGGINPDVTIEAKKVPTIAMYLMMDNVIFDYATQWAIGKDKIASPEIFTITDEDYENFKHFVKERDFTYDRQSEKVLKNLKEVAEFEGYMDTASEEFKALEAKLKPDLDRDLDKFKPIITAQINEEIIKRFYFQKGKVRAALRDDIQLQEAIKLLNDKEAYSKLLSAPEQNTEATE